MRQKGYSKSVYACSIACCIMLLCCAGCNKDTPVAEELMRADPSEIVVETANATEMSLSTHLDSLCGMTHQNETLIVHGMREGKNVVLYIDKEGVVKDERSISTDELELEAPAIYDITAANDLLYALVGPTQGGGEKEFFQFCIIDKEGEIQILKDIVDAEFWNYGSFASYNNSVQFWYGDKIIRFDEDGSYHLTELPTDEEIISLSNHEGETYAFLLDEDTYRICEYDMDEGLLSDVISFDDGNRAVSCKCGSFENSVFVNAETHLIEFDPEAEQIETRFSWTAVNMTGEDVASVIETAPNHFVCAVPEQNKLVFITTEKETIKRTRIVIGAVENTLAQNLEYCVSLFNNRSKKYYADIQYYKDHSALSMALGTGNAPDVLEMSQVQIPLKREYFKDIIPFLQERGIEEKDFTGSLWRTMQIENQLLMLPDSVRIDTLTARSKDVGTEPGWSWDEFYETVNRKGEEINVFPGWMTSDDVMLWMTANSLGRFINYSDMTCQFDDEEFIKYLNFCKNATNETLQEVDDYSENTLLVIEGIGILWRIIIIRANYHGDEYTFIGFPDDKGGCGNYFRCANTCLKCCIPVNAKCLDGAGEFLEFLFSKEWQYQVMELPVRQEIVDERMKKIETPDGVIATASDIEKLKSLVSNTNTFIYEDIVILDIVREEAGAYIRGDKTAEEVADIIQNRVSIYLQEKGD